MFDPSSLLIFMTAAIALLIVPGPAVTFIVARTVEHGRFAGIVSVLGIMSASLVHITLAALGLSALLLQSVVAFSIVKYIGAGYLVYLGIRALGGEVSAVDTQIIKAAPPTKIYRQGFIVNLFNPKSALFLFAFLPQFIDPQGANPSLQIIGLGLIFLTLAFLSDSTYVLVASAVRNVLMGSERIARFQKNFAGVIYILLGITTAVTGQRQ